MLSLLYSVFACAGDFCTELYMKKYNGIEKRTKQTKKQRSQFLLSELLPTFFAAPTKPLILSMTNTDLLSRCYSTMCDAVLLILKKILAI